MSYKQRYVGGRVGKNFTMDLMFGWGLKKHLLKQNEGWSFLTEGVTCAKTGSPLKGPVEDTIEMVLSARG